jgi:acetyl-CoA carboxylase biotin carboxyl carrier protein
MNDNTVRTDAIENLLDTIRRSAQELGTGAVRVLSAVRMRAGDVVVELEWTAAEQNGTRDVPAPRSASSDPRDGDREPDPDSNNPDLLHDICAPTVGVFYRAPEPGAPPFVTEGAVVEAGQQMAVLEAMKIMIPVEADRCGRVFAVMTADGAQVEYGEPLFSIEPLD